MRTETFSAVGTCRTLPVCVHTTSPEPVFVSVLENIASGC